MNINPEATWWEQITGPARMLKSIESGLRSGCSIYLLTPSDLPWRHKLRLLLDGHLNDLGRVEIIDCADECIGMEPGDFLLQRFADPRAQLSYRVSSRETIQEHLMTHRVLNGRIVWIKGLKAAESDKWFKFIRNFRAGDVDRGLFVLETQAPLPAREAPSCIRQVTYDDFISVYDALLFDSLLAAEKTGCSMCWKQYTAAVAQSLWGKDVEAAVSFIQETDLATEDPLVGVRRTRAYFENTERGICPAAGQPHPFFLLDHAMYTELERRVWEAQVQVLFPLIERGRISFIQKYEPMLQKCLEASPEVFKGYGEKVEDLLDIELGHLIFLTGLKDAMGRRLFYVSDPSDYQRLHFLRDCRNKLAHLTNCSPEEVKELFAAVEGELV